MDLKFKDNSKLKLALFTQLEYLESTGTQYIDTGIIAEVTDNFEIEYQFISGSGERSVFGIHGAALANMIMYDGWWWGGISRYSYSHGTIKHILTKNNNIWTLDGTQLSYTTNSGNIPTGNWSLFTAKSGSDYTSYAATAKIYRFKLYRGNTLLVDFVPALDNNKTPCMFDTVSKAFFYNKGTGNFIAGPILKSGLPENILLKTTTLYYKNTPNVDGFQLLNTIFNAQETAEDVVLNRIRVDIGNVSGSITELMRYSILAGFNDAGEEQAKPRLVGTWTINDWYTSEQFTQVQAAFDGLTIIADPNYLINFDDMAVQVLDDTQPNYNPAVAIRLQANNIGNLIPQPLISGKGKWFINKSQAASLTTIPICNFRTITDSNGIVSNDTTATYNFISFNEFVYFTGITTLPNGMFNGAWLCPFFKLPDSIVTTRWCWQGWDNGATCVAEIPSSIQNYSALFGFNQNNGATSCAYRLHFNHLIPPTLNDVIHQAANNIIFYVGNGESKINDSKALELFKSANYWKQYSLRSWYDFAAPKVVYDGSNVTITVKNTSTIYYTTDGSTPSENSTQYSAPFAWDGQGVIKAIAIDNYDRRTQAEPFYAQTVSNPTFTVDTTNNQVIINCATSGATIYYTTDGTYPTTDSYIYSAPITSQENIIKVRCFATIQGYNNSEVVSKTCVMDDSLWGTDGDTSSFAVQCMDATKPNYNPAVCIVLDNNGKLSDKCYNGGGGYITKTDAAAITSIGTWFKSKTNVTDTNGIVTSDTAATYQFTDFDVFQYFSGVTRGCALEGSSGVKYITLPPNFTRLNDRDWWGIRFIRVILNEIAINLGTSSNVAYQSSIQNLIYRSIEQASKFILTNNRNHAIDVNNVYVDDTLLTELTIDDSITDIGYTKVLGISLTKIILHNNITKVNISNTGVSTVGLVGSGADVELPTSVTTFGPSKSLTSIELPSSITTLSEVCFYNKSVGPQDTLTIPSGVTVIPSYCFAGMTGIKIIELQGNVTNIDNLAFYTGNGYVHLCGTAIPTVVSPQYYSRRTYVGLGQSQADDEALLATFRADSTWSSKNLDTWYNYLHPQV